jgi:hypothetical protein
LELLVDGGFVSEQRLKPLIEETNELISIFVKMVINTKARESK